MALPWFFRKLFGDTGNNGKIVDDVIPDTVVKTSAQTLDATKQAQARDNIGAGAAAEVTSLGTRLTAVEKNTIKATSSTADLTAGTSALETGHLYLVYE